MALVRLERGAGEAILAFLAGRDPILRIEIRSTGCCDASLCLALGGIRGSDRTEEVDGITFAVAPEVLNLAGEVTVSYLEEGGKKGFVLRGERPISEWDGFGCSEIRVD